MIPDRIEAGTFPHRGRLFRKLAEGGGDEPAAPDEPAGHPSRHGRRHRSRRRRHLDPSGRAPSSGRHHHRPVSRLSDRPPGPDHHPSDSSGRRIPGPRDHLQRPIQACPRTEPARGRDRSPRRFRPDPGQNGATGAILTTTDLRASAALVLGDSIAGGRTTIRNAYQLFRGYENMPQKLQKLGAAVTIEEEAE